jgi:hypothetical protein
MANRVWFHEPKMADDTNFAKEDFGRLSYYLPAFPERDLRCFVALFNVAQRWEKPLSPGLPVLDSISPKMTLGRIYCSGME